MPAQVIGGAPGELPLMARFDLPGGRHRIRFTSLTASGELIDRWVQAQTVPDLTKQSLVLATPKILRARNMVEFRAIESNPAASPTASTRLAATDRVLVEIEYQALGGQTPQIKVDLLNAKGDLLQTLRDAAAGRRPRAHAAAGRQPRQQHLRPAHRGDCRRADRAAVGRVPRRPLDEPVQRGEGVGHPHL